MPGRTSRSLSRTLKPSARPGRGRPTRPLDRVVDEAWAEVLRSDGKDVESFDPATMADLPGPAQRLLSSALPAGTPLRRAVVLEMTGTLKVGPRWLPFRAEQILRLGVGFVWKPVVGTRWFRFVGADLLCFDQARTEFRLFDRLPVVRATGPDVHRSAGGRHVAETVAWLPQALAPQAGATWTAIDDDRAAVMVAGAEGRPVEVAVDPHGRLREIRLDRWNASTKPPESAPFGGRVDATEAFDRVHIAGRGVVGWDWGSPAQDDGVFFTYQVTGATFLDS